MAFVNEFISEEDIKRHGLDELKKFYDPWAWRDGRPVGFIFVWTIDRDRGIFTLPIFTVTDVGRSGRSEPTRREIWFLEWQGERVRFVIERTLDSSAYLTDSPYLVIWDLVELDLNRLTATPRSAVIEVIKEALSVYGHRGANRQVPDTIVRFNF